MTDGRRVENRLAALESSVNYIDKRHKTFVEDAKGFVSRLDRLEQQLNAQAQPDAECPKCNDKGVILSYRAGGHSLKPCDCGRAPVLMNESDG